MRLGRTKLLEMKSNISWAYDFMIK